MPTCTLTNVVMTAIKLYYTDKNVSTSSLFQKPVTWELVSEVALIAGGNKYGKTFQKHHTPRV